MRVNYDVQSNPFGICCIRLINGTEININFDSDERISKVEFTDGIVVRGTLELSQNSLSIIVDNKLENN